MTKEKIKILLDGKERELPIIESTIGVPSLDIRNLGKYNYFTYDPGFTSTAACTSKITYIDGNKGELLYRGYPIEQLAENICESIQTVMENRSLQSELMVVKRFVNEVLPSCKATYEKDGEVDGPARREEWCNFIDYLNKSGELSDYEAANIDIDVESL